MEYVPERARAAFRPLAGTDPKPMMDVCGCRWPVHPDGDPLSTSASLFCDEPVERRATDTEASPTYCAIHRRISEGPGVRSEQSANHDAITADRQQQRRAA